MKETRCIAVGDPYCEWEFRSIDRFAPLDKPITDGVYRVSRNPMYFSMFFTFIGIGLASASWFFLLLTIIWLTLSDRMVITEERYCLETYGEACREYMNGTHRWIGIPESRKKE